MFAVAVPPGLETDLEYVANQPQEVSAASFSNQILIIEDDIAVLEATRIMLESVGARVACAMSAERIPRIRGSGQRLGPGCRPQAVENAGAAYGRGPGNVRTRASPRRSRWRTSMRQARGASR